MSPYNAYTCSHMITKMDHHSTQTICDGVNEIYKAEMRLRAWFIHSITTDMG